MPCKEGILAIPRRSPLNGPLSVAGSLPANSSGSRLNDSTKSFLTMRGNDRAIRAHSRSREPSGTGRPLVSRPPARTANSRGGCSQFLVPLGSRDLLHDRTTKRLRMWRNRSSFRSRSQPSDHGKCAMKRMAQLDELLCRALAFAMGFPSLLTWVYFVLLA